MDMREIYKTALQDIGNILGAPVPVYYSDDLRADIMAEKIDLAVRRIANVLQAGSTVEMIKAPLPAGMEDTPEVRRRLQDLIDRQS